MLHFQVYDHGQPARRIDLQGAHGIGAEGVPTRVECHFADGKLRVSSRGTGPVGLALLWPVEGFGKVLLETTRLPGRQKPYNLNVEIARWRLQRVLSKREEWGLLTYPGSEQFNGRIEKAEALFIQALQKLNDPPAAAALADEALTLAMWAGEQMAGFHGEAFLARRKQNTRIPPALLGAHVDIFSLTDSYRAALKQTCGLAVLPFSWKTIEPKEQEFQLDGLESWAKYLTAQNIAIKAAPLVCLSERYVPDWLFIWEHDFEALRDLVYEHVRTLVGRFGKHVRYWGAVCGLNRYNCLNLTFDQLIELTRITAQAVKKVDPKASVVIDLVQPWGEYYARGPRTIPPQLYVDFVGQSNVPFDAIGLEILMGVGHEGYYVRDLLQISSLLDKFANLGKPIHVSAVQVPSATAPDNWDHWRGARSAADGGTWRAAWNENLQAQWLEAFYTIAASKPFVECICWRDLADYEGHFLPHGGLMHNNLAPKAAYHALTNFRSRYLAGAPVVIDQQRPRPPGEDWDLC
jgi:hypothetical protein